MSGDLALAVVRELASLGRWAQGRAIVRPGPNDEVIEAVRYLEPDFLRSALLRCRSSVAPVDASSASGDETDPDDDADVDVRIAVSRFTRHYSAAVMEAALTAMARGVALDISIERCRVVIRGTVPFTLLLDVTPDEGRPCEERPTTLPAQGRPIASVGELRELVWKSLFAENLAGVFALALDLTHVSERLLWTNAAEHVALLSDSADEQLAAPSAAPFVEDRVALLGAESLPGIPGSNPMRDLIGWDGQGMTGLLPHGTHRRQVCCVTYHLQDRLGRLCGNCPFVPVEDRIALVVERHGAPRGAPGGPAEQRVIELGLRKLGRTKGA